MIETEFAQLRGTITGATDEDQITRAKDRAEELGFLRAYIYPIKEIAIQGQAALAELPNFAVPPDIISVLKASLGEKLRSADLGEARSALEKLFIEQDYWEWYSNSLLSKLAVENG